MVLSADAKCVLGWSSESCRRGIYDKGALIGA